ncbi:MAG: phosphomannomutase/phosphoglucomutase [Rhodospirillaceae bacterium]|nr:phosphomannomutase/phosphoglucomutase [Rhodospirillaceae bacterium]MBT5565385.1 phosphomannomutase/phosphoglucomutase [Rhodospirillaceae bacterium]
MTEGRSFHPSVLREYDIRGIIGETLYEEDATALGRAFGTLVIEGGGSRVCVGYDGRQSSPGMEAALVEGLRSTGLAVDRVGLGPSPMLYYAAAESGADAGIMVTGSHNPPNHNGFKMVLGRKPFYGDAIKNLGTRAATGAFAQGNGIVADRPAFENYVSRVLSDFKGGKELSVVWDPGNGAAGDVVTAAVKDLPGRHLVINGDIDGTFPNHHPDPTVPENLEQLRAAVAEEGADVGFAFDGDGDRIGIIDGNGSILWGDQILIILGEAVLAERPGAPIIADVKASQVLFDEIARLGGQPVMAKTGHSLIKAKMNELDAPLAGEMSGHIFFADHYYGFDDALYAAVRFLSILSQQDESLADRYARIPKAINTPELRFPCPDDRKFAVIEEVKARLTEAGANVNDIDGVRVSEDSGWWLLRASNTQAVLVARCEADSEASLAALKGALAVQLEASGVSLPD